LLAEQYVKIPSVFRKALLRPLVEELLGESWLRQQGLFKPQVVRRLLDEHNAGAADHHKEIWTLLILQLWLRSHSPSVI
jgi:asparagine synthase (glutamine-hydrolysing)